MSSDCDLDEPVLTLAKYATCHAEVPKRVLDSGAGCGKFSFMYPRLPIFRRNAYPKPEMVGTDIDLKELVDLCKVTDHVVLASSTHLPFRDNAFDLGFLCEVIEHLSPCKGQAAIRELMRTCSKLVVSTPKDIKACHVPSHIHQWLVKELSSVGLRQYPHRNYLIFTNIAFPSRLTRLRRRLIPNHVRRILKNWLG